MAPGSARTSAASAGGRRRCDAAATEVDAAATVGVTGGMPLHPVGATGADVGAPPEGAGAAHASSAMERPNVLAPASRRTTAIDTASTLDVLHPHSPSLTAGHLCPNAVANRFNDLAGRRMSTQPAAGKTPGALPLLTSKRLLIARNERHLLISAGSSLDSPASTRSRCRQTAARPARRV